MFRCCGYSNSAAPIAAIEQQQRCPIAAINCPGSAGSASKERRQSGEVSFLLLLDALLIELLQRRGHARRPAIAGRRGQPCGSHSEALSSLSPFSS